MDSTQGTGPQQGLLDRLVAVDGVRNVSTDGATLDRYSHDAWPVAVLQDQLGQHVTRPDVVVTVTSADGVVGVLQVAREEGVALTPRGLGSSVTGQPLPTQGGIVLDLSGLVGEPHLDEHNFTVRAPAGVLGWALEEWLQERGYTHAFYPQSLTRSSIGGWIATRATGQLSSRYGGIEDAAVGYTIALSDGSIIEVGQHPRAAVGPDVREIFLGSEGMFGVVLDVTLRVHAAGQHVRSEAWTLPSAPDGIEALRRIYQAGIRPSLMRLYDATEARHAVRATDDTGPVLFLSHEGLESISEAEHTESRAIVESLGGTSIGPEPVDAWYARRFDFSAVEQLLAEEGGYAETIEVAHQWSGIQGLYDALVAALAPYADEVLGHFSHVYTQGVSLYVILLGRVATNEEAAERLADIWRVAMETTTRCGGELSHHHGAGLARQAYIAENLGPQHVLIGKLKEALDPAGILNPGHLGL